MDAIVKFLWEALVPFINWLSQLVDPSAKPLPTDLDVLFPPSPPFL
ncbi:MAG: hypothetical protein LBN05_05250 [Oscillospiraceae bacterium]|jgi:hypothetical protein|nr:hypothetical protein [Oscillospiraceae bacterium]